MANAASILFVCDLEDTGRELCRLVRDLALTLDGNRFAPSAIIFKQCPESSALEQAGIAVTVVPAPDWLLDMARHSAPEPDMLWRFFSRRSEVSRFEKVLAGAMQTCGASVVATAGTAAHVHGGAAARRARRPALWLTHEWFPAPPVRLFMNLHARRTASALVCCSHLVASQYRTHQAPMIIPPGENTAEFAPGEQNKPVRERLGIPANAPVAGMAADAYPGRGHALFLRAAARIREDIRDAHFVIAGLNGDSELARELTASAEQYGLASRLLIPGHEFDEVSLIGAMDVFVHPSQRTEPFGRDIVRAMLLGKPVAASASGGPDEIVRNAETGILVDAGDSVRLARAVVQLMDNPEVMNAFGENGRARALDMFTMDKTAREFQALLERVIA